MREPQQLTHALMQSMTKHNGKARQLFVHEISGVRRSVSLRLHKIACASE